MIFKRVNKRVNPSPKFRVQPNGNDFSGFSFFQPFFGPGPGNQAREAQGTRPGRVPQGTGPRMSRTLVTKALEKVRTPLGRA